MKEWDISWGVVKAYSGPWYILSWGQDTLNPQDLCRWSISQICVATALHCKRSCARETASVRDMQVLEEMCLIQIVLGRPLVPLQEGSGDIHLRNHSRQRGYWMLEHHDWIWRRGKRILIYVDDAVQARCGSLWCGLRPSVLGQDRSETKEICLGLGLAGLMLCCETWSCHARRRNDLEGHSNFSSTIYSFSLSLFCAWNITTMEINSGVHLVRS